MSSDSIKTIREALDEFYLELRTPGRYAEETLVEARAALDSLDAELAEARDDRDEYKVWLDAVAAALHGWPPDSRKTYVPTQLAGKAARMAQELATLRARLAPADSPPGDAQQPESDDQRAERELGAWLVAHPGWSWVLLETSERFQVGLQHYAGAQQFGEHGGTRAAAILDALAKARDAEGGKS